MPADGNGTLQSSVGRPTANPRTRSASCQLYKDESSWVGGCSKLTEVIQTDASLGITLEMEVASSTAVKDSCKLQAVSFPSRHLRDFTSTATRTRLSNFSDLTTCQDRSGDFYLSGVRSALRTRPHWSRA